MKIKTIVIPFFFMIFYLITSIYQVLTIPPLESALRFLRLASIPILLFAIIDLVSKLKRKQARLLIMMGLPILIILFVTVFQLLALPPDALSIHISGSVRIICWSLTYLCLLLSFTYPAASKYNKILVTLFFLIFIVGLCQYPSIINKSGTSINYLLSSYGQFDGGKSNFGIFGSANEDANALMSLFPIALLFINKIRGIIRIILIGILFIFFPIAIIYNGTRTALLVTYPLILFLFYSNLSLKKIVIFILASPIISSILLLFSNGLFERAFAEDASGGGSFSWRLEHSWIPAVNYTLTNSPIFGFGSRGWEYVVQNVGILTPEGEFIPPHSAYVWVYISWGIIGLIAYLAFLLVLLKNSFQLSKSKNLNIASTSKALFCSVIAYCIWAFISNASDDQGWLILFAIGTLIASLKILEYEKKIYI
jgi:O-antigen ligase